MSVCLPTDCLRESAIDRLTNLIVSAVFLTYARALVRDVGGVCAVIESCPSVLTGASALR